MPGSCVEGEAPRHEGGVPMPRMPLRLPLFLVVVLTLMLIFPP